MLFVALGALVLPKMAQGPAKGGLYENVVADMLAKQGQPIRYWVSGNNQRELEFVLDGPGATLIPLEVKASNNVSVSLDEALRRDDVEVGYKLADANVGKTGKKVTLPLYLAAFLFDSHPSLSGRA